jgi:hypothetical protein
MVGNASLEPGEYEPQHKTKGTTHFIRFSKIENVFEVYPESFINTYTSRIVDVRMPIWS